MLFTLEKGRVSSRGALVLRQVLLKVAVGGFLASGAWSCEDPAVESPAALRTLTFEQFVAEMDDLEGLTRMPDPAYVAAQTSSRDPRSVTPASTPNWYSNEDAGHFLRMEDHDGRTEAVMLDATGPGVVTRIWSANPTGVLRIYVDSTEPSRAMPMKALLDGSTIPAPLSGEHARGFETYVPIAYTRSCKITVESPSANALYWQVGYRRYPPQTPVEPFRLKYFEGNALRETALRLARGADSLNNGQTQTFGETGGVARFRAPSFGGEVLHLGIESNHLVGLEKARLILRFDGQETANAPLLDFFGGRSLEFWSLALTRKPNTATIHFRMPFEREFEAQVVGVDLPPFRLLTTIVPRHWDHRSLYFHATAAHNDKVASRPITDFLLLDTQGEGRLAGLTLRVDSRSERWWGEGDEHIWVDNEKEPSFFGTGTEDHFGYGWCSRSLFSGPYNALTEVQTPEAQAFAGSCSSGNVGRAAMHRAFIFDSVPFRDHLHYELESWHQDENTTTDMASVTFWYGARGSQ